MKDLDAVVRTVHDVAETVTARHAAAVDAEARWPAESMEALRQAGVLGLVAPVGVGGLGLGMVALARACEELGRYCPSSALCFGMHCVGTAVLAAKATPFLEKEYLEAIAAGKHITTLALSEPGSGAHFYFPSCELDDNGQSGFVVSGQKSFVTNGGHADSYVVSTRSPGVDDVVGEFSCVVVDAEAPGMVWGDPWVGTGMRGNSSRRLTLSGVPLARGQLLGEEGDQIWFVFSVVAPYFLAAMAGTYLGAAAAALDEARCHLKQRVHGHSGRALGEHTVLQHRLGVMWGTVERTRRLVYHACGAGDAGDESALPAVLTAKAEVADCANQVVGDAMTILGGLGYERGGRMERLLRDVRAAHVMAPTTDLLRVWCGRALLGVPLLADR